MSSKSDVYQGVVVEQLPDALFAVRLDDSNRRIVAHVDDRRGATSYGCCLAIA